MFISITGKYSKLLFVSVISFDFKEAMLFVKASKIGVCKSSMS